MAHLLLGEGRGKGGKGGVGRGRGKGRGGGDKNRMEGHSIFRGKDLGEILKCCMDITFYEGIAFRTDSASREPIVCFISSRNHFCHVLSV